MIRLLLSASAGTGVSLIVLDRLRPSRSGGLRRPDHLLKLAPSALPALATGGTAWLLIGSAPVAAICGAGAAVLTPAVTSRERRHRTEDLADAWPRLLDEANVLCGPGGLGLAQALFMAARSAGPDLRLAWSVAERTWRLSADLSRALDVVKEQLGDPTTALVCLTLSVVHEAGGTAQHDQLARLVSDRRRDAAARRTAEAQLAGARFARRFVLIMPVGMAVVGQSIGSGRAAFGSATGQLAALVAAAVTGACWIWSGRLLAVPTIAGPPA